MHRKRNRRRLRLAAGLLGAAAWALLKVQAGAPANNLSAPARLISVTPQGRAAPGFTPVSPQAAGILFFNFVPESRHLTNQILLNGSGVAAGDVDGDGRCDLYFCSLYGRNALYRNLGGWRFADITRTAGVGCPGLLSTGAALADVDGDGDLDLLVNTLGMGTRLFFNDGKGRFAPGKQALNPSGGATTMALGDADGDGWLDLYIGNYRVSALMDMPNARVTFTNINGRLALATINGRPLTDPAYTNRFTLGPGGGIHELGQPDVFYRNLGDGRFVAESWTSGRFLDADGRPLRETPRDWALSALFRDANGDGLPDLYVCNDFQTEDRFWVNQGGGRFRLIPWHAQRKSCLSSMAADFGDINGMKDRPPLIRAAGVVTNRPQYELNELFLNRGDFTFAEIGRLAGIEASEWSWSCAFMDVDLDGFQDLLVINGMQRAARDWDVAEYIRRLRRTRRMTVADLFRVRRMYPRQLTANIIFHNRGNWTFEEVGRQWGFALKGISNAMALADLDGDGDLDVAINNFHAPPFLLRNDTLAPRIAVRLRGRPPNTHGIGARVQVEAPGLPLQTQEIISGGRYLSCDETLRVFAAGAATNRAVVRVRWRSGAETVVRDVPANVICEIQEPPPPARAALPVKKTPTATWFEDLSERLRHRHHDEWFNDFDLQPLLPRQLSQFGPGICWIDLDGDGRDDLFVGSGRGGRPGVFHNDGKSGFSPFPGPWSGDPVERDQLGLAAWPGPDGRALVFAASSNYEDGESAPPLLVYDLARGNVSPAGPELASSAGPLAAADVDGDGDLDLFVGGRVNSGRYPEPADSLLLFQDKGRFFPDARAKVVFRQAGLVSGAVFSDVDGDGDPDLLLACEWGPIRLFLNERGQFRDATSAWGLDRFLGWWTAVTTGDFDNDGLPDLIACNWGRNTRYEYRRAKPPRLYYGDYDDDETFELLEAYFDPESGAYMPWRQLDLVSRDMPFVRARFSSHRAYAMATAEEILGDMLSKSRFVEVNWFPTTLFLNRTNRFEARPLPAEAQVAPAFGAVVADFDGDGREDVFLAQNFFPVQPETPRYDAGRGLLLLGNGRGGLRAVPGQLSGIRIYGEGRGAAAADFDGDGRWDLAVGQNGYRTVLLRNRHAKPGLRVRLSGSPANPRAAGARLRLWAGNAPGPAREIQLGGGFLSQNSSAPILTHPRPGPYQLEVRWPDGRRTRAAVPPQARGVTVDSRGNIRPIQP